MHTKVDIEDVSPRTGYIIAESIGGVFAGLSIIISFGLVWQHLQQYEERFIQKNIVRILLMVPVYSLDSWISLMLADQSLSIYFDTIRDCYEAYVIYCFFALLIGLLGGEENLIEILEQKSKQKHPFPFSCFYFQPGSRFLHRCKQMILQFVIVKPILATFVVIFTIVDAQAKDKNDLILCEGNFSPTCAYPYILTIDNVSIFIAMYYLVLFYIAATDELAPFRPLSKFLCIKTVIFFAFWQEAVIAALVYLGIIKDVPSLGMKEDDVAKALQDFIICIEMFLVSLAHIYAFGLTTYKSSDVRASIIIEEVRDMVDPRLLPGKVRAITGNLRAVVGNFGEVVNQKDVLQDTVQAFAQRHRKYITVGDFFTVALEEQVKRVEKQGWLLKKGEIMWSNRYVILISKPPGVLFYKSNPNEIVQTKIKVTSVESQITIEPIAENEPLLKEATAEERETEVRVEVSANYIDSPFRCAVDFIDFRTLESVKLIREDSFSFNIRTKKNTQTSEDTLTNDFNVLCFITQNPKMTYLFKSSKKEEIKDWFELCMAYFNSCKLAAEL